jgi:hypothetical protein
MRRFLQSRVGNTFTGIVRCVFLAVLVALAGCTSISGGGGNATGLIIGSWQSDVGGFPVTHTYDESTVRIEGHAPLPYQVKGDELMIDAAGSTQRVVTFPSRDEMVQSDPLTGTTQVFSRVN